MTKKSISHFINIRPDTDPVNPISESIPSASPSLETSPFLLSLKSVNKTHFCHVFLSALNKRIREEDIILNLKNLEALPIQNQLLKALNLRLPSVCTDNRLCRILLLYIPGCSWQWLPAALWLLLYVPFKTLFQRGTDSENSLYSNDSLISCFLVFVVFATEMCVQILIKRWASLYCLLPLTVPLDWTPANRAIYFPLPSFFPPLFPCKNQFKDFLVCSYKSLLISVFIWEAACSSRECCAPRCWCTFRYLTLTQRLIFFVVADIWSTQGD